MNDDKRSNHITQTVTMDRQTWAYVVGGFGLLIGAISVAALRSNDASVELVMQALQAQQALQSEQNEILRDAQRDLKNRVALLEAYETRRRQMEQKNE